MPDYEIPQKMQKLYDDIQPSQLSYHRRRVAVTKKFTFDAAHHLYMYEGKCKNLHGHTYRLEITVSGFVDSIGMVIDFADLKKLYQSCVAERMDHKYLNEALPAMNTTAENMVVWIWEALTEGLSHYREQHSLKNTKQEIHQDLRLEQLVLYETPTSCVTLKREWMEP